MGLKGNLELKKKAARVTKTVIKAKGDGANLFIITVAMSVAGYRPPQNNKTSSSSKWKLKRSLFCLVSVLFLWA
jgi:hypothetical protein